MGTHCKVVAVLYVPEPQRYQDWLKLLACPNLNIGENEYVENIRFLPNFYTAHTCLGSIKDAESLLEEKGIRIVAIVELEPHIIKETVERQYYSAKFH
jgi:hypothetical protein